jgi:hypothetical protein
VTSSAWFTRARFRRGQRELHFNAAPPKREDFKEHGVKC